MSSAGGVRGTGARAVNPGAQRRSVIAFVNLFEISLDRMGRMVYQYDGSSSYLSSSVHISSCV